MGSELQRPRENPFAVDGSPPPLTAASPRPPTTPGKVLAPAFALLCLAAINGLVAVGALKDLALRDAQLEKIVEDEEVSEDLRDLVRKMNEGAVGKWVGVVLGLVFSLFTRRAAWDAPSP